MADHDSPPRAAAAPPRVHGGPDGVRLRSLGIDPAQVIDFSVNVNPYGPAPAMRAAIQSARVDVYPDSAAHAARVALGLACGVMPERIALGNGGADLLWTLARLLLSPRHTLLMVEPTFSELRAAAVTAGARVVEWRASGHDDFRIDLAAIAAAARTQHADVIYLCAPNNPTGVPVRARDVAALADALPAVTIVLDQAFLSLSAHAADAAVDLPASVVRVRSLTKEHAIPGVRVGYLIATPALAAAVESARPAWTTGAAAQAAAIASCALGGFVDDSCARMLADRRALASALVELGLRAVPTEATYLVVDVGSVGVGGDASRIVEALLVEHRILVRDCASFGLPGYIRLAARPADDRARLLAALTGIGRERDRGTE